MPEETAPQAVAGGSADVQRRASIDEPDDNHIRVICRVKPLIERAGSRPPCVAVGEDGKSVVLKAAGGPKQFTFDHAVGAAGSQEEMFQLAGRPATRSCLQGYNGTIFCYGQTGSGKTFTMFGPNQDDCNSEDEKRGLVPRVLEYLFSHISREERRNGGSVKHLCRCSFYEIFNEKVFDLLDANCSMGGLQVREDLKKGVYVEGLTEEAVESPHHAYQMLAKGYRNRHVGETAMNRESSRSHAVFTLILESREVNPLDGITRSRCSSFHLVDLAGSERQSATGATGERLKEAGSINKSLSALGNVINALVEAGGGKTRYIPYRDSRLSFLLRDSLGGNAKTFLVAALSATEENFAETLSTLKFAQRAKMIKNKAVVNENTSGTVEALQKELRSLRQELLSARALITASTPLALPSSEPSDSASQAAHETGAQGGDVISAASATTVRRLEALLRDALDRSVRVDKARELCEQRVRSGQQNAERLEQALLSEKMVRKLKESQLARLKNSRAKKGEEGQLTEEDDEAAVLRQELELLRKEMEQVPRDTVKWRLQYEDTQAQLTALADKNGLGMWVSASEESFALRLQEELKEALESKTVLTQRVEQLQEELIASQNRPPPTRRLSDGGLLRLRDAESKGAELEERLAVARRMTQDAENGLARKQHELAQALAAQSQLTNSLTSLERQMQALKEENQTLRNEREAEMIALQERTTKLQAQEQDQALRHDLEGQLAAACRDNCILLQRLRDTATETSETTEKLRAAEADRIATFDKLTQAEASVAELEQRLAELQKQSQEEAERHTQQEASLRQELEGAIASAQAQDAKHDQEMCALQSRLDEASARLQSLRADKEDLTFQLANLQEDHETQGEMLELQSRRRQEAEEALTQAQADMQEAQRVGDKQADTIDALREKMALLEAEVDRAGEDVGKERKELRVALDKIQTFTEENATLSSSLESVREELACVVEERARNDTHSRETEKRQQQVINDLTEQVSRLRGELCEAEARAQSTQQDLTAVTQEIELLRQRAEEAEEARAALAEETKVYVDELEKTKARLLEREEQHEGEVRALRQESASALHKAKEDAQALHGEVGVLRWEADSLREALDKAKADKEEYRQMAEEARGQHDDQSQALASLQQDVESRLREAQEQVAHLDRRNKELEKDVHESQWRHTEDMASLKAALADAQARAAEASSLRSSISQLESQVTILEEDKAGMQRDMETLQHKRTAAEERCDALAKQVGEALSLQKDLEAWWDEKARLGGEVARARAMETEAYERYEVVEEQRQKVAKEVHILEKEVEELKAANVRLIGHANSRQKIQLHRKLKEELSAITVRAKQLEDENYKLRLQAAGAKNKSTGEALRGDVQGVLTNVTNIMKGAEPTR